MTSDAIEHLQRSAIENIHIVGRRGYVQAACTIKELRELTQIPGVDVSILSEEIALGSNDASLREVEERRPLKRITQLMRDISAGAVVNKSESVDDTAVAATERSKSHRQKRKKIHIRFLLSPKEFTAATNLSSTHSPRGESDSDAVNGVVFEKCVLDGPAHKQRAIGTGRLESINCDLVLTSVGYKSEPLRDIKGHELPFDYHSNTIHHSKGRIIRPVSVDTDTRDANATTSAGNGAEEFRGLYVAGWLKRGPSGIIGTNITDAKETVQSVCEDALNGLLTIRDGVEKDPAERLGTCKIVGTGRNGKLATGPAVSWEQHLALDSEEKRRGEMRDPAKPREKITSVAEMLEIIRTT
ncbi:fdxr [Symbiodinium microadriaticum]|nr:fdxr [Symbiodinium microadriaticum]